ncbi:MAG TPA: tRNA pseudouridine(55) synthase TruB [Gemmatimonadaceae bacterium]|nr:tRNA pseudouridine(55) synthase TruB [Gemmatimonadaceae bacterium]
MGRSHPIAATPTTEPPAADRVGSPNALLLVDKPAGLTSHDVVARVRRALRTKRVGHTGTLDPFATGLLVVLISRGTRLIPYVEGEPKVYEATIRLGSETDTDDLTGTVLRQAEPPSDAAIADAIARLTGAIDQIPPSFSAKQVDGQRAYDAARKGTPLHLPPVRVTVHEWTILHRAGNDLAVRITCGGGTYIRALARDLGRLSGSAAHLAALRRTRSGPFDVSSATTLDDIDRGQITLAPLGDAIPAMPRRTIDAAELTRVLHGNSIDARGESGRVALVDHDHSLIAIAERENDVLRPKLVLHDA